MIRRSTTAALLSCLLALVVALLGAAVITVNLGGITAALRGLQFDFFSRLLPGTAAALPKGDLLAADLSTLDSALGNAAVLWPQLLFLLLSTTPMLLLLARGRAAWAGVLTLLAIAFAFAGSWFLFARASLFLDALSPSLVLSLAFAAGALADAALRPRRTLRLRAVETAPEISSVTALPRAVRVPAQRRTVTCLVCTLAEATGSARKLDPADTLTLVESVVTPMLEAVAQLNGRVISASGDRLFAVWNAFPEDAEHALHACEAALRMTGALTQLKDVHGEGSPYDALQVSVGVATGSAAIGALRYVQDGDSVVGQCAEGAERLSRLASLYGAGILVSEETRNSADDKLALLEMDTIDAGPDRAAAKVYALYGNPLVRASPKFRALTTFHDHLFAAIRARRWDKARELMGQCSNLSGAIPQLYRLHTARIDWLQGHPPPPDWGRRVPPPVM